jgi:hypothetical protein
MPGGSLTSSPTPLILRGRRVFHFLQHSYIGQPSWREDNVNELNYAALNELCDDLERYIERCEVDIVTQEVMRRRHLRCTAETREAAHQIVERYYRRWREANFDPLLKSGIPF